MAERRVSSRLMRPTPSRFWSEIKTRRGFGASWSAVSLVGWEGDVLGRHGGIDRDPRQILRPQRRALVRHAQALGQEKFQLVAEALAPGSGPSTRAETRAGRTPLR